MNYRKTKGNWERPSLNPMNVTRTGTAAHPTAPWEQQSDEQLDDFDRELELMGTEVKSPWAVRSQDLVAMDVQKQLATEYEFKSMFAPEPMSKEKQLQLANYKINPPFLCSYNFQQEENRPAKKIDLDKKNPKTKSPWEYGALPADPLRRNMHAKPKTTLWDVPSGGDQSTSNQAVAKSQWISSGDPILDNLRLQLSSRGASGLIGLSKKFRIIDDDGSGTLNYEEFRKGMKECGLTELTERALRHLFLYFGESFFIVSSHFHNYNIIPN
jgi:hypothetical protein